MKTAHGHNHKEAFCLMQYQCETCGHLEVLWNSRDGVTPFTINCSHCGANGITGGMKHVRWNEDAYAQLHKLKNGQRYFTTLTKADAEVLAAEILEKRSKMTEWLKYPAPTLEQMTASLYGEGDHPTIKTHHIEPKHCCEEFTKHTGLEGALQVDTNGKWSIANDDTGNGKAPWFVLEDIKHCPFCGTKLEVPK